MGDIFRHFRDLLAHPLGAHILGHSQTWPEQGTLFIQRRIPGVIGHDRAFHIGHLPQPLRPQSPEVPSPQTPIPHALRPHHQPHLPLHRAEGRSNQQTVLSSVLWIGWHRFLPRLAHLPLCNI